MYHNFKTTLYHGTISEIQQMNVDLGLERKNFGKADRLIADLREIDWR